MKSFIPTFNEKYAPLLNVKVNYEKRGVSKNLYQRTEGYEKIFNLLEDLKKSSYKIVETGTLRIVDDWKGGCSTVLFQEFVKTHSGHVYSVDINPNAVKTARSYLGEQVTVTESDSVSYLESNDWSDIDLFYLDSYDVKWQTPEPSAEHHLKEFKAIEKYLTSGKILAIDDNTLLLDSKKRTGKGMKVYEYLHSKGVLPVYDEYQIIYKF